jgi:hypothetical protein
LNSERSRLKNFAVSATIFSQVRPSAQVSAFQPSAAAVCVQERERERAGTALPRKTPCSRQNAGTRPSPPHY